MSISTDVNTTVGALAAERPASIAVFERLGLDYCCGGRRPLGVACRESGLDPAAVLGAIDAEERKAAQRGERDWTAASMTELADHIEQTHHAFVRDVLARLERVVPRVVAAHGRSDPRLQEVGEILKRFDAEMRDHMEREERVLFPWLRRLEGNGGLEELPSFSVERPIDCMMHDHDDAGEALAAMRRLTDGYAVPERACATYRSMLTMLGDLERDTHAHVHKENNILFPAGVRAEERACTRGSVAEPDPRCPQRGT